MTKEAVDRIKSVSPELASVIARGWGMDAHHSLNNARFYGDSEIGVLHFHPRLTRAQVNAIAKAIDQLPQVLDLVLELIGDGECYCTDNTAASGPCAWCKATELLRGAGFLQFAKSFPPR